MPDKPRVLLFGSQFPPSPAGTAIYARCLATGLAQQGTDVAVLTQGSPGDDGLGLPVTRVPETSNVLRRYGRLLGALRGHLERFRPHVLWTTNGMGTRVAGLLRSLPCPLITCARGSDIRTRLPPTGPWRWLESHPQRRAYRQSWAIAAASKELRDYAATHGIEPKRLFLSPSAFDFSRMDAVSQSLQDVQREPAHVLTVARLTRQKRVDVVLRAIAIARQQRPELRYTVVGDGPEASALQSLTEQLGLTDCVDFVGALPPLSVELCRQYRRASVFALTSVGEGLANVYLEAGAFALPSLGCNSGGTPEIIDNGRTGRLARPDDPQDTAGQLVALLQDADVSRRMGEAARERVQTDFGVEALGVRARQIVDAVMADQPLASGDAAP